MIFLSVIQTRLITLQKETQDFITKVFSTGKKSDFDKEDNESDVCESESPGDQVCAVRSLEAVERIRNPAGFDQKLFYPEDTSCGGVEADVVAQIPHVRALKLLTSNASTSTTTSLSSFPFMDNLRFSHFNYRIK